MLLPPPPGRAQTVAMYFRQGDVANQLDRPLTASLTPRAPTVKTVTKSPDAGLVQQRTSTNYLFSLMGSSFNDRAFLVLDPYSAAADDKLQKRARQADEGCGRGHRDDRLGRVRSAAERAALAEARARLDTLDFFARPVRMRFVRLLSTPWLFRLPWFRRFDGYTMWDLILLRGPIEEASARPRRARALPRLADAAPPGVDAAVVPDAGYADNPNEVQARRAASLTS